MVRWELVIVFRARHALSRGFADGARCLSCGLLEPRRGTTVGGTAAQLAKSPALAAKGSTDGVGHMS